MPFRHEEIEPFHRESLPDLLASIANRGPTCDGFWSAGVRAGGAARSRNFSLAIYDDGRILDYYICRD